MEPGGSVLCSQEPPTCPYTEPDESSLQFPFLFLELLLRGEQGYGGFSWLLWETGQQINILRDN